MKQKKVCQFDVKDLLPIGLTFIVFGIAIAYGLNVMGDIRSDVGTGSCANASWIYNDTDQFCHEPAGDDPYNTPPATADFNASRDSIIGIAKLPSKLPLIATVVVAAVIIGILVRYLMVRFA